MALIRNLLLFLSVCFVLSGCKDVVLPVDQEGATDKIGIVGEMNNEGAKIGVYYAANLTRGTASRTEEAAAVSVSQNGQNLDILHWVATGFYQSTANFIPQIGTVYEVNCLLDGKKYTAEATLPDSFSIEMRATFPVIHIEIQPHITTACNYVIQVFGQAANGGQYAVGINSTSVESDNFIYNEIYIPYKKLFFQHKTGIVAADIEIAQDDQSYPSYTLVVRSVPDNYYLFLYNGETQQNERGVSSEIPGNVSGGASGFVGAAFVRRKMVEK